MTAGGFRDFSPSKALCEPTCLPSGCGTADSSQMELHTHTQRAEDPETFSLGREQTSLISACATVCACEVSLCQVRVCVCAEEVAAGASE